MRKTSIGGSALLEGIMMIGPHKKAIAVRKPDGDIDLTVEALPEKRKLAKIPVIRGAYSLIYQMILSIKALTYAASFYDLEEENQSTKQQTDNVQEIEDTVQLEQVSDSIKVVKEKPVKNETLSKAAVFFAILLSVGITVGLFILLPNFVVGLFKIKNVGALTVHISPYGTDTIDGDNSSVELVIYGTLTLLCYETGKWCEL